FRHRPATAVLHPLSLHDALPISFQSVTTGTLPGLLGVEVVSVEDGRVVLRLAVRPDLLAPNGYLHAGAVVALADTACGYGCFASDRKSTRLNSSHLVISYAVFCL